MKTIKITLFVCCCTFALISVLSAEDEKGPPVISVQLRDGSRIVGTTTVEQISVVTQYGKIDVPMNAIMTLTFEEDGRMAGIATQNGDYLQGELGLTELLVEAAPGLIRIPIKRVVRIDRQSPRPVTAAAPSLVKTRPEGKVSTNALLLRAVATFDDNTLLIGTCVDVDVPVVASYGKLLMPMREVAVLEFDKDKKNATFCCVNGDILTGEPDLSRLILSTVLGEFPLSANRLVQLGVYGREGERRNISLHRNVQSQSGNTPRSARSVNGEAAMLTDGDPKTRVYPESFVCDYVINLQNFTRKGRSAFEVDYGFPVEEIKILWGSYGRKVWVPKEPRWELQDYVVEYWIGYRTADMSDGPIVDADVARSASIGKGRHHTDQSQGWISLHEFKGRPATEAAEGVQVTKTPPNARRGKGDITTRLLNLGLRNVSEIRIRATGKNWIGIHEVEVYDQ